MSSLSFQLAQRVCLLLSFTKRPDLSEVLAVGREYFHTRHKSQQAKFVTVLFSVSHFQLNQCFRIFVVCVKTRSEHVRFRVCVGLSAVCVVFPLAETGTHGQTETLWESDHWIEFVYE